MTLAQYLVANGLTQIAFLRSLNSHRPDNVAEVTPAAMSHYARGLRSPSDGLKSRIRDLTSGAVDGNAWLDQDPGRLPN